MMVSVMEMVEVSLVKGWRERVTEAQEVVAVMEEEEEEEEAAAMAVAVAVVDRSHVHGARNGASRTTRSAITQVALRTT